LAPVLLGQGEPLLHGLDLHALGFCVTNRKASEYATHCLTAKDRVPAAKAEVCLRSQFWDLQTADSLTCMLSSHFALVCIYHLANLISL
jgi:hypothetical protein